MGMIVFRFFTAVLFMSTLYNTSLAEKRIALVIGNNSYINLSNQRQLQKAIADADAVSQALGVLNFDVINGRDMGRLEINRKLQQLYSAIEPGDTVAFFFAGHGVRLDGRNFLLASNVPKIESGTKELLKSESVSVDTIVDSIERRGAKISILILDACRNDPFEDPFGRSVLGTNGLARVDPPEGTFVLFSAGTGQVALDRLPGIDPDPNSIFTRKLLPLLTTKNLEIGRLKDKLQVEVRDLAKTVGHRQTPAAYDQIIGDFYLAVGDNNERRVLAEDSLEFEFDKARNIDTEEGWNDFLSKYGDKTKGNFVERAKASLNALRSQKETDDPVIDTKQLSSKSLGIDISEKIWPIDRCQRFADILRSIDNRISFQYTDRNVSFYRSSTYYRSTLNNGEKRVKSWESTYWCGVMYTDNEFRTHGPAKSIKVVLPKDSKLLELGIARSGNTLAEIFKIVGMQPEF